MIINNQKCSFVIDNYDTIANRNGNPRKSYLFPLFIIEENQIHFIRITSKIPKENEKIYIEINWKEIELDTKQNNVYIRFDRIESEIHIKHKTMLKNYKYIYNEKLEKYRKEILIKALNCPHIQPIYYEYIHKEIEIINNKSILIENFDEYII